MMDKIKLNKVVGFKRSDSGAGFEPLYSPIARQVDGNHVTLARIGLLRRIHVPAYNLHPATRLLQDAAPGLLGIIRDGQNARTLAQAERAEEAFCDYADGWLEKYAKAGEHVSAQDAGIYSLLSPIYAMPEVIERAYMMPTLYNLLPKMVLNTAEEIGQYLEYEDHVPAASTSWDASEIAQMASWSGSTTPKTIRLAPIAYCAKVTMREKELHAERMGKQGVPAIGDLFGRAVEKLSQAAIKRAGQLAAYGDADLGVEGLISNTNGVTAVNVDYASGTGLTDYGVFSAQIAAQAAQVNEHEDYVADTILIDSVSFRQLGMDLLSNTGDEKSSVLSAVFANAPDISVIAKANELGPRADEIAVETPKVGATEAAKVGGGYLDGTYRRCMVITRGSDDVQAVIEGLPLSVEGLDPQDGADRSLIRMSSGGCKIFRTDVPRIVYI